MGSVQLRSESSENELVLCCVVLYQALDLAAEATTLKEFKDWWWKARLGKCYYKLGKLSLLPICVMYAHGT